MENVNNKLKDTFTDNLSGKNSGEPYTNTPLKFLTASSVMREKVKNDQEEDLGKIHDIMLNIRTGKVEYYVIEFGGFLGMGEKLFAIPFHLLTIDPEEKVFRLNIKKEVLKKAPGFDKNHWPDTNEHKEEYVNLSWGFWDNPA